MITIKNNKYNLNLNHIGYNCITGTNFEIINEIINGIDNFFGGKKDIDLPFSISDGDFKLNKKDYIYLKISPLLHSIDEIEITKTSYIKKIISDITDILDENSGIYNRLTKVITNEFENNKNIFNYSQLNSVSNDLDNINLQFSISEINKKLFLDSILKMEFIKNGKDNEILTNYEITNIVLNIIKIFLSMNTDKKVLILIDNIEYKMNYIEKEKILSKILSICDDRCCILHFVENIVSKDDKYILERTTIINDAIISKLLDDKIIRDIQDSFPAHLEYDKLIELYISFIIDYYKYLSKKHYFLISDKLSNDKKKILYSINDVFRLGIDNIL